MSINEEMPWQSTKKIGTIETAYNKEKLYSHKVKDAKYKTPKISKGVYDEVKTESSYLISYKEKNKKNKEQIINAIVDLTVLEKYQTKELTQKEKAVFLAEKVANNKVIDSKFIQAS